MSNKYELEKWLWTESDFEVMRYIKAEPEFGGQRLNLETREISFHRESTK
jgi:hypothetical protein